MLTAKQEAYSANLLKVDSKTYHQWEAFRDAGYSTNCSMAVVYSNAARLANSNKILSRVTELRNLAASDAIGTVEERQKRLTEIYRANLTDFVTEDGTITLKPSAAIASFEIEEFVFDQEASLSRRTKKLKLRDPVAAIQEHNKMEKIYDTGTTLINDNRQINLIVQSKDGKQVIEQLRSGKLPELKTPSNEGNG